MPERDGMKYFLNKDIDEMRFDDVAGDALLALRTCSGEDALFVLRDMKRRDNLQVGPDLFLIDQGGSVKVRLEQGNPDSPGYRRLDIGLIRPDGSTQASPRPNLLLDSLQL
jgi:hypothetical protein